MRGPQLFSGWYHMILDDFQCSQLFSDVFSGLITFMDNHPLCGHFFSIDHLYSLEILRCVWDVLRCSQMFTDVFRWSQIFFGFSLDIHCVTRATSTHVGGWAQHLSVPQYWVQWWVIFEAKLVWLGHQGGSISDKNYIKDKPNWFLYPFGAPKIGRGSLFNGPNCSVIYERLPTGQI